MTFERDEDKIVGIAIRLRTERERLGLSQSHLARLLDVSRETMRKWEVGLSTIGGLELAILGRDLGFDVAHILTGEQPDWISAGREAHERAFTAMDADLEALRAEVEVSQREQINRRTQQILQERRGDQATVPIAPLCEASLDASALQIVKGLDGIAISQAGVILDRAWALIGATQRVSVTTEDFVQAAGALRDASR